MREIQRTALVPFTPEQMFALVDDIERYAEFLPWVIEAKVINRLDHERVGQVTVSRAGFSEQFTTRNTVAPPHRLAMTLIDGPFNVLEGVWTFDSIGEPDAPRGTRINLELRIEFKNRLMDILLAPKYESSCDTVVDAFVKRARAVYGAT
jgi:ribosome-associated toxin RatA of RatAB toxin-antitoxin module